MDLSGNMLILSGELLTPEILETLNKNLPEFSLINKTVEDLETSDLDRAIIIIGDYKSVLKLTENFKDYEKFPPTLLMTDDPLHSIKSTMEDFVYDTFDSKDAPLVVYRRIRNALFFALKSRDKKVFVKRAETERNTRIQKILKASKNLIPLRDTESSIRRILTSAASILNCEGGMIFLVDKDKQLFTGFNLKKTDENDLDSFQEFELSGGIPGHVYQKNELYICNDPLSDDVLSDEIDKKFSISRRNLIAIPLVAEEETLGIMMLYNKNDNKDFSDEDAILLKEISDISTQIIQNTHYFENHSNFFTQAIKLLIIALEAHDEYFKLHSDSVTAYVDRMVDILEIPLEDSLSLHFAAIFHDIGKLRIDSKILTKDAPLTQIEKKRLSLHSTAGEELLKGIKIFNKSTMLIRHHHEWYNGTGFPDGLEGDQIPYGSRIIHICEAFDSMTSIYLPHRIPLTLEEACKELRAYGGAQFDPDLVEVFINEILNK